MWQHFRGICSGFEQTVTWSLGKVAAQVGAAGSAQTNGLGFGSARGDTLEVGS
jgi:hypothetical protein